MLRDISIVMRGTVVAQAVGILMLPIISRLYAPSTVGQFAVYQGAVAVLVVFACLRYEQAVLSAKSEREAVDLFKLCFAVAMIVGLTISVMGLVASAVPQLDQFANGIPFWWYGPATFSAGLFLASQATLTRIRLFRESANSKMGQAGSSAVSSVLAGSVVPAVGSLVLADILSKILAVGIAMKALVPTTGRALPSKADLPHLKTLARSYRQFPKVSVVGGVINNGVTFITPAALIYLYGADVAGQFALADRVIGIPLGLVIVSVSQVFAAQFGGLLRETPSDSVIFYRKTAGLALIAGVVPAALGAWIAPAVFPALFGDQWVYAGEIARLLAISYLSALMMGPISSALVVMQRLDRQLQWEAFRLAAFALVWVGAFRFEWTVDKALVAYAACTVLCNLAFVIVADRQLSTYLEKGRELSGTPTQ